VIPEKLTFAIMGMERDASKMFDWFRSDQPAADVGGRRSAALKVKGERLEEGVRGQGSRIKVKGQRRKDKGERLKSVISCILLVVPSLLKNIL
jgi:hypothetical protein